MEISKFPEILAELSMHKQCVPGSFFSAHALEPGNEARPRNERTSQMRSTTEPLSSLHLLVTPGQLVRPGSNENMSCVVAGL